jgi:hypothetical protein
MHDDHGMDKLLRETLATGVPQLSPAFEASVMKRLRPRRLAPADRIVLAVYSVAAAATAAWLMRDLPIELVVAALVIAAPIAAGVSAYGRRLAFGA